MSLSTLFIKLAKNTFQIIIKECGNTLLRFNFDWIENLLSTATSFATKTLLRHEIKEYPMTAEEVKLF